MGRLASEAVVDTMTNLLNVNPHWVGMRLARMLTSVNTLLIKKINKANGRKTASV